MKVRNLPYPFLRGQPLKFENEMTNDVIYSTQYYIKYINRAILVNLQWRPLKFERLIVLPLILGRSGTQYVAMVTVKLKLWSIFSRIL